VVADVGEAFGAAGVDAQLHAGGFRGAVAFFVVAFGAAADEVVPLVAPAAHAGDDVVDGEGQVGGSAIDTAVAVTREDALARGFEYRHGAVDGVIQPHYRGMAAAVLVIQRVRLAQVEHGQRPSPAGDVQRLIIMIQYQDLVHRSTPSLKHCSTKEKTRVKL